VSAIFAVEASANFTAVIAPSLQTVDSTAKAAEVDSVVKVMVTAALANPTADLLMAVTRPGTILRTQALL